VVECVGAALTTPYPLLSEEGNRSEKEYSNGNQEPESGAARSAPRQCPQIHRAAHPSRQAELEAQRAQTRALLRRALLLLGRGDGVGRGPARVPAPPRGPARRPAAGGYSRDRAGGRHCGAHLEEGASGAGGIGRAGLQCAPARSGAPQAVPPGGAGRHHGVAKRGARDGSEGVPRRAGQLRESAGHAGSARGNDGAERIHGGDAAPAGRLGRQAAHVAWGGADQRLPTAREATAGRPGIPGCEENVQDAAGGRDLRRVGGIRDVSLRARGEHAGGAHCGHGALARAVGGDHPAAERAAPATRAEDPAAG
jgi:hypothetical protein